MQPITFRRKYFFPCTYKFLVGFTWYSLTDQVDWDSALVKDNNNVNPLGLYDLNRKIRPVGKAYKELISTWKEVLSSECYGLHFDFG